MTHQTIIAPVTNHRLIHLDAMLTAFHLLLDEMEGDPAMQLARAMIKREAELRIEETHKLLLAFEAQVCAEHGADVATIFATELEFSQDQLVLRLRFRHDSRAGSSVRSWR